MKIKQLKEAKSALLEQMQALVGTCEVETRSMDEVEDAKFKELEAEIRNLENKINEERARAIQAVEEIAEKSKEEERGLDMNKEIEKRTVANYIRGNYTEEVRDAMQTGNTGASIVTENLHNEIVEKLVEVAPLFAKCRLYEVENGKIDIVKESEAVSDASFVGENAELAVDGFKLEKVTLQNKRCGSAIVLTNALIADAGVDIAGYSMKVLTKRLGNALDKAVINGKKEQGQPEGLLSAPASCEITTISSGALSIDDFITAYNAMHPHYLATGACWIMNKQTFDAVSKMKDSTGNYYIIRDVQSSGIVHKLLGLPVMISVAMTDENKPAILVNLEQAMATMLQKNGASLTMIGNDTQNSLRGTQTLVLSTACDIAIYNEDAIKVIKKKQD